MIKPTSAFSAHCVWSSGSTSVATTSWHSISVWLVPKLSHGVPDGSPRPSSGFRWTSVPHPQPQCSIIWGDVYLQNKNLKTGSGLGSDLFFGFLFFSGFFSGVWIFWKWLGFFFFSRPEPRIFRKFYLFFLDFMCFQNLGPKLRVLPNFDSEIRVRNRS